MEHLYEKALESAEYIKTHTKKRPKIAVVLGSGLGKLTADFTDTEELSYKDIPNFPVSTVAGHKGALLVREAGAEALIVGANEGVRAHHVDEVGNEHQGARRKLPVDAAAGVGQHHLFHVQQLEHIERVADFLHGVALIEMEAAFHGVDFRVPQLASQQCAFVVM